MASKHLTALTQEGILETLDESDHCEYESQIDDCDLGLDKSHVKNESDLDDDCDLDLDKDHVEYESEIDDRDLDKHYVYKEPSESSSDDSYTEYEKPAIKKKQKKSL